MSGNGFIDLLISGRAGLRLFFGISPCFEISVAPCLSGPERLVGLQSFGVDGKKTKMPKKIPLCPPIPQDRKSSHETRLYRVRLITPLFGGGVEPGDPDESFPIRGTAIRGQLQFWWRATQGASCSTREELFERHKDIWGTTDRASLVQIEAIWQGIPPVRIPCAKYTWDQKKRKGQGGWNLDWEPPFRKTALPYVLFPFQGKEPSVDQHHAEPEKLPAHFIKEGEFLLRVRFPEAFRQDVETAIWAWVNFGGLGARTRRGCGSLSGQEIDSDGNQVIKELAPSSTAPGDLRTWFQEHYSKDQSLVREWPTLSSTFLSSSKAGDPIAMWGKVVEILRHFRQGPGLGRNEGNQRNRPGRSRWPEPETIRAALPAPRNGWGHDRQEHIPSNAFPRAEFGLPIVFHFQGQNEPPDTVLYPSPQKDGSKRERMSSPLILKPLALSNGETIPVILRLRTHPLDKVDLRRGVKSILPFGPSPVTSGPNLATYHNSPLKHTNSGSAIDAFWALAQTPEYGFTEVKQ